MKNINRIMTKIIGVFGLTLMAYGAFSFTPLIDLIGIQNALRPAEIFMLGFFLGSFEIACMLAKYRATIIDKENPKILSGIDCVRDGISLKTSNSELINSELNFCFKSYTRNYCYTYKSPAGHYFKVNIEWKMPRFKPNSCLTTLIPEPSPTST